VRCLELINATKQESKRMRARIPLYEAELAEYPPNKQRNAFVIVTEKGEFTFKAMSEEDMQFWLNALLKAKFSIESSINSIALDVARTQ
jgi:hypothetical protein